MGAGDSVRVRIWGLVKILQLGQLGVLETLKKFFCFGADEPRAEKNKKYSSARPSPAQGRPTSKNRLFSIKKSTKIVIFASFGLHKKQKKLTGEAAPCARMGMADINTFDSGCVFLQGAGGGGDGRDARFHI